MARRWATDSCEQLGRHDLLDTVQLAVSELATNALLHGAAPIWVAMRGTVDHPRIEVADGSPSPPRMPEVDPADPEALMATFGRGLTLVAMCSKAWGATLEPYGKVVWFEPVAESRDDDPPLPDLTSFRAGADVAVDRERWIEVVFDEVPILTLVRSRQQYYELRRELGLLALSHNEDYPLAGELTAVFTDFERSFDPRIVDQIAGLIRTGEPVGRLCTWFDPDRADLVRQMMRMLDLADEFCRAERLLALARPPQMRAFQNWYFGEFVRQAGGAAPTACPPEFGLRTEPVR